MKSGRQRSQTRNSLVMRLALRDVQGERRAFAAYFINEPMLVGDAAAPVAVQSSQGFGFADAGVAVALNVLDQCVDTLEDLLVLKLPSSVFVPGARCESDQHGGRATYASINSCCSPLPSSRERIDSARTRWLASDQKGSSAMTSKGMRRRMTTCLRKRRTALDMSRPAPLKKSSACLLRLLSTRICSVDVAICKFFVVQDDYIISQNGVTCTPAMPTFTDLRCAKSTPFQGIHKVKTYTFSSYSRKEAA